MVTELIRILKEKVFLRVTGKVRLRLVYLEGPLPFQERFEVQVETPRGSFHPYSVYPLEVKGVRRARRIAAREYRHFARKLN